MQELIAGYWSRTSFVPRVLLLVFVCSVIVGMGSHLWPVSITPRQDQNHVEVSDGRIEWTHCSAVGKFYYQAGPTCGFSLLGLAIYRTSGIDDQYTWRATMPLWLLAFCAAVSPARAFFYIRKERFWRWRVENGFCGACGYDLRASPERCPECGMPVKTDWSSGGVRPTDSPSWFRGRRVVVACAGATVLAGMIYVGSFRSVVVVRWADCMHEGRELFANGQYADAEAVFTYALRLAKRSQSATQLAPSLNALGWACDAQRKHEEAARLYDQVVAMCEDSPGTDDINLAISLQSLGEIWARQGRADKAEAFFVRAIAACERSGAKGIRDLVQSLNSLACVRISQQKRDQADPLWKRSLHLVETQAALDDPRVAKSLIGMAKVLAQQGDYAAAETMCRRGMEMSKRTYYPWHPALASLLAEGSSVLETAKEHQNAGRSPNVTPGIERPHE